MYKTRQGMNLPVILHVQDIHKLALRMLRWNPARKPCGAIHCFYGPKGIAVQYLKLDSCIGLGGSVVQLEKQAKDLWEAITHIPLEPYLIPTRSSTSSKVALMD